MNMQQLSTEWQKYHAEPVAEQSFRAMRKAAEHPTLRWLRRKLTIETLALVAFVLTYYSALDGDRKPLWLNTILLLSAALYITTNILAYRFTKKPPVSASVRDALLLGCKRLQLIKYLNLVVAACFSTALMVFLTAQVEWSGAKYLILSGMVFTGLLALVMLNMLWNRKIRQYCHLLEMLDGASGDDERIAEAD